MSADRSEHVLVTGFPKLGARKLVAHLLEREPETRVTAIVLPKLRSGAEDVAHALPAEHRRRLELLEGDAAAMDMGLSGTELKRLTATLTRIHHLAQVSYVGVDRAAAEYTNIGGAAELIEIGRLAPRLRCIVHHSTAHVSGDRTGVVYEHELDEGQGFHSVVQRTRMKAEQLLRRAMPELPIAVVRPTMMVGDSITGEAERFDGPYLLVMLALGLPRDMAVPLPDPGEALLDIVPVDFAIRAAHHIGLTPGAAGRTYQLTSGEPILARRVFDLIVEAGGRRTRHTFIPTQVASALLRTPGIDRLLNQPRAFMQQLSCAARYDARNTKRVLQGTDICCPPLASYVDTWVAAVQRHLRERRVPAVREGR